MAQFTVVLSVTTLYNGQTLSLSRFDIEFLKTFIIVCFETQIKVKWWVSMLNNLRTLFTGLLILGLMGPTFGQVELKIGTVTVAPSSLSAGGCIQVPIFLNDPDFSNRDFRDLTITVAIEDPSNVIAGGIAGNMFVLNGMTTGSITGITNPGTDLTNNNGTSTPTCGAVFNQATEGQGAAVNFTAGVNGVANWAINNNQGGTGRKQGFLIDLGANNSLGSLPQGVDSLIGVLEIPIISSPGQAQITVTAVPVATVEDGNTYNYEDGTRDEDGNLIQIKEDYTLPAESTFVNIFDPVNCAGASATPASITWAAPSLGGIGGALTFNFPGTALADRVHLTSSDGLDVNIASAGATTTHSIDTMTDGSPTDGANRTYTATYEVEFPPASGTFVAGSSCTIANPWADVAGDLSWDPQPVFGGATTLDVVLTNAVNGGGPLAAGGSFATLTGPNGVNVALSVPTAGGGTNVLTFADALTIDPIDNSHVGTYTVAGISPDGSAFSFSIVLTLDPPVNETSCAAITEASIEGSVTIPLAGNLGTVDFTVVYDGTTYANLPAGDFVLNNIVGDVTTVLIQANGFDAMGGAISDDITCDLNYALPSCAATQDPAGIVDVGTVITLFLDTTNAVAASINGTPMTPDVDPDDNFNVQWSATHVAISDTTITGIVTNADGETSTCTWTIDINCIDPSIVSVAPVGDVGITIYGTFDCVYTIRIIEHNTGTTTDYDVLIDTLTNPGVNEGTGTLSIVVPPDAWIEVGQLGFPFASDMVPTVPTLGEWGLIAFITLLMGAGVFFMRKRNG